MGWDNQRLLGEKDQQVGLPQAPVSNLQGAQGDTGQWPQTFNQ